jgi:hypothetical protein
MTGRHELYADALTNLVKPDFKPQVINDTHLE